MRAGTYTSAPALTTGSMLPVGALEPAPGTVAMWACISSKLRELKYGSDALPPSPAWPWPGCCRSSNPQIPAYAWIVEPLPGSTRLIWENEAFPLQLPLEPLNVWLPPYWWPISWATKST